MPVSPLIEVSELAAVLDRPDHVIVDCRFSLMEPAAGFAAYRAGHIPGARYADLDHDLARRPAAGEGRHPLPARADFAARVGQWGIDHASVVVAYDDASGAVAARFWWMMRWLGHERSQVLNGGFAAWTAQGFPVETATRAWQPRHFEPSAAPGTPVAATEEVAAPDAGRVLVDVRAAARFRGEQEPIDPVAGHVPGAVNHPFTTYLGADGRFPPPAELRQTLGAFLGTHPPQDVVAMCGSGVTACHLLLAMEAAGLSGGRLYAGSWSEWIRDPGRPVATGAS